MISGMFKVYNSCDSSYSYLMFMNISVSWKTIVSKIFERCPKAIHGFLGYFNEKILNNYNIYMYIMKIIL